VLYNFKIVSVLTFLKIVLLIVPINCKKIASLSSTSLENCSTITSFISLWGTPCYVLTFFFFIITHSRFLAHCLSLYFRVVAYLLPNFQYLRERKLHSLHALIHFVSFFEQLFPPQGTGLQQNTLPNPWLLSDEIRDSCPVSGWTPLWRPSSCKPLYLCVIRMEDYKRVWIERVGPAASSNPACRRPTRSVCHPLATSNYFKSFYEVSQLRIGGSQFCT
jgi:hypothetical protein